jgi:hypothetical protein
MIPETQTHPGIAATRAKARGADGTSARDEATSTATKAVSAVELPLLSGAVGGDEELAVGALEAAVPFGLSGH